MLSNRDYRKERLSCYFSLFGCCNLPGCIHSLYHKFIWRIRGKEDNRLFMFRISFFQRSYTRVKKPKIIAATIIFLYRRDFFTEATEGKTIPCHMQREYSLRIGSICLFSLRCITWEIDINNSCLYKNRCKEEERDKYYKNIHHRRKIKVLHTCGMALSGGSTRHLSSCQICCGQAY